MLEARPHTHVGKEVAEIHPPIAEGNPAPTILRVGFIRNIKASLPYANPYFILKRAFLFPATMPML